MTPIKNMSVPGAADDLGGGLGDQLQSQVEAQILERRKKILAMATQAQQGAAYGALSGGTGLTSGLGNMGFAAQALLGQGGLASG